MLEDIRHEFQAGYYETMMYTGSEDLLEALREYALRADSIPYCFRVMASRTRPEKQEFERICRLISYLPPDERPSIERAKLAKPYMWGRVVWSFAPAKRQTLSIFAPSDGLVHRLPELTIKRAKCPRGQGQIKPKSGPCEIVQGCPPDATEQAKQAWFNHQLSLMQGRKKSRMAELEYDRKRFFNH